ncbi:MAG: hypothetical protein JWO57_3085 [Pseudonocardiales bacterium]|nr:hypothetical protein [Pseudonocardiales bacterium]
MKRSTRTAAGTCVAGIGLCVGVGLGLAGPAAAAPAPTLPPSPAVTTPSMPAPPTVVPQASTPAQAPDTIQVPAGNAGVSGTASNSGTWEIAALVGAGAVALGGAGVAVRRR